MDAAQPAAGSSNGVCGRGHGRDESRLIVPDALQAHLPTNSRTQETLSWIRPKRQSKSTILAAAFSAIAAAQLGMIGSADAQTKLAQLPAVKPGTHTSFGPLKQIDAGLLNVGYAEAGPADGPAVVLLHGWPYDIYSFVDVTPLLASAGYR